MIHLRLEHFPRLSTENILNELFFFFFPLSDLDGKLYDAYVAFPPPGAVGYSDGVESFAIHVLPEVLEKACGYKLFIAGRDCLPGQGKPPAVLHASDMGVTSVHSSCYENLMQSITFIWLYWVPRKLLYFYLEVTH